MDEDEYLRYRISEWFNMVMKSLFDSYKTDKLTTEQAEMKELLETFLDTRKTEEANKAQAIVPCRRAWAEQLKVG